MVGRAANIVVTAESRAYCVVGAPALLSYKIVRLVMNEIIGLLILNLIMIGI